MVQIFLGRPWINPERTGAGPIDTIDICSVFVRDGRVLGKERYSRSSTEEERASAEPPVLSGSDWYISSDETAGFLSLDGSSRWVRIAFNGGPEGNDWFIFRVADGMPRLWQGYLTNGH